VSLALTWPPGFVYSEFSCAGASATSFPLSKHTGGGDTAPAFSGLRVNLQFLWEVTLPSSPVVFLPPSLLQALLLLVAGRVLPLLLAGVFVYSSVRACPSPSLRCVFFVVVYYSVSLFSLGGGRSVQGAMLWPSVFCGSTVCHLAHLVFCIFPSGLGAGI
jgi:hypothetical protein